MQLGQVLGTVVATQRTNSAEGWTLRIVEYLNQHNQPTGKFVIAVDSVGASDGEVVLVTTGSAARQNELTAARPCDAIIMAIVDTWAVHNEVRYTKYA